MKINKILLTFCLMVLSAPGSAKTNSKFFISLDAVTLWAKPAHSQRLTLVNNLGNTYLADPLWQNNNTLMLGLGLRSLQRNTVQVDSSIRLLPMTGISPSGGVLQLHEPRFYNLDYTYKIKSNVLLFDHVISWTAHGLRPGLILGLGATSNTIDHYRETPLNSHASSALDNFSNNSQWQFAYELGAVLDYALKDKDVIIECAYRFINAGLGHLGKSSTQNTLDQFSTGYLHYHTLSLGIRIYHGI